jgi:hypothetical protein
MCHGCFFTIMSSASSASARWEHRVSVKSTDKRARLDASAARRVPTLLSVTALPLRLSSCRLSLNCRAAHSASTPVSVTLLFDCKGRREERAAAEHMECDQPYPESQGRIAAGVQARCAPHLRPPACCRPNATAPTCRRPTPTQSQQQQRSAMSTCCCEDIAASLCRGCNTHARWLRLQRRRFRSSQGAAPASEQMRAGIAPAPARRRKRRALAFAWSC